MKLSGAPSIAADANGGVIAFGADQPLRLDSGGQIADLEIAYQAYGRLNAEKSNAILVCHALSLDQHVALGNPATGRPGWWANLVGPGRSLDPDRHFII